MTLAVTNPATEAAGKADFSLVRYAQCWEDADVLPEALETRPGMRYLSIGSAGDNALALVATGAADVVALDINPAQIALMHLKVEAFRRLSYKEMRDLLDWRACPFTATPDTTACRRRKLAIYDEHLRDFLPAASRAYWYTHREDIAEGVNGAGKFERYFSTFRERMLPLVHGRATIDALFAPKSRNERERFYAARWNTWRWRALFAIFFSKPVLGRLGRDPRFFDYVSGDSVANRLVARTKRALVDAEPDRNPYLQWILNGRHDRALPLAFRPEWFEAIKTNLGALRIREASVESFLASEPDARFDGFNLSDIFEYMSEANYERLLRTLVAAANPGARLAYWNMLVPRTRPETLATALRPETARANELYLRDKAFFYERLVIETVL